MTQAVENDTDIVWPDEEHLFAADNLSSDERAVSPSSDSRIGGTDDSADQNTASFGEVAAESSDANEYWDHDDRFQGNRNLSASSPGKYPVIEEETDFWMHDKFDLLKIGPPPGLGGSHKAPSSQRGHHQQNSRRPYRSRTPIRVLVVPRPPNTGQMPPGGWPEKHYGSYVFPVFSVDDLNDDSKTPWPEESEIRSDDIDKWGWHDDDGTGASSDTPVSEDVPVPCAPARTSQRRTSKPGRGKADRAKEPRASRLSHQAEQTLQQVDQRNADLAALMTRLRLQELRQQQGQFDQHAAYQDPFAYPHAAAQGSVGYRGQDQFGQDQSEGPPTQYQFSNGVLVPNYAVPMPPTALPSSPASMRPSLSRMFDQLSQQAGSDPVPGPPPPPPQRHMANSHAQVPGGSLDRTGAGYMASSRKGHQGYAPSSGEFPLKPGHLKVAQPSRLSMSATPPPPPAVPFHQLPASLQPPLLPSGAALPNIGSRAPGMSDPTHQAVAAAAAWAAANVKGIQAAAPKPGKRALAIIDPESKQALSVLPSAASGSTSELIRTDSANSAPAANAEKPGKKLISIVDPSNKQPIQLPVKPLDASRLIRTQSTASAASSDGSLPAKRAIAIVDPNNKQPVALPSSMLSRRQPAPAGVQVLSQSSSGNGRRAKAPIAIMDPVTASEVQLPARDISTHATPLPSAAGQSQGRLTRARKLLAIVDPKTKAGSSLLVSSAAGAQAAAQQSSAPSLARAPHADTVKLTCSVADNMSVRCSLHLEAAGCSQHPGLGSQGAAGDAVKLQLSLGVGGQVACRIVPSYQVAGGGYQPTGLGCPASQ